MRAWCKQEKKTDGRTEEGVREVKGGICLGVA
jgi:hypothetical protein